MAKPPNYTVGARQSSRMSYVCYKKKYYKCSVVNAKIKFVLEPSSVKPTLGMLH